MTELEWQADINTVVDTYSDMIYRLAYSKVLNPHDASDIMQEVFLRYIRARKEFNGEEHRKAWLIRVTVNCGISSVTSGWSKNRSELDENLSDSGSQVSELETKSTVYGAVRKLPQKYRTVIHLFYYEDMTVEEISRAIGKNANTVKSLLKRAREKLSVELSGVSFDV